MVVIGGACGAGEIGDAAGSPRLGPGYDDIDGGIGDPPQVIGPEGGTQPERPGAHNTGPTGPLTPYTGPSTITQDGATYEDFTASWLVIDADNVTLRNFRIDSPNWYGIEIKGGHSGILLEDGEILGSMSSGLIGVGFTGRRLYIHDTDSDAVKTQGIGGPTIVEYSFIEKLGLDSIKPDGNQIAASGTSNVTFRYNNIWMPGPGPNSPGPPYSTNACAIHEGNISDIVYEHNWLNGGNFTMYCGVPGISVRNNRFGRDYIYGIRSGNCDEWTGNVWDDTEEPAIGNETK